MNVGIRRFRRPVQRKRKRERLNPVGARLFRGVRFAGFGAALRSYRPVFSLPAAQGQQIAQIGRVSTKRGRKRRISPLRAAQSRPR